MKDLARNKRKIAYLNYRGKVDVVDSDGFKTGEKQIAYTRPVKIKAHVSGAKGNSMVEVFGTDISYDKTILLTKSEFTRSGINENSVFFVDTPITYLDGLPLYDYRVKRIADTPNQVLIAVEKVSASNENHA